MTTFMESVRPYSKHIAVHTSLDKTIGYAEVYTCYTCIKRISTHASLIISLDYCDSSTFLRQVAEFLILSK